VEGLSWSKKGSGLVAWHGKAMLPVLASRSSLPPPPAPPSSTAAARRLQDGRHGADGQGSSARPGHSLPSGAPLSPLPSSSPFFLPSLVAAKLAGGIPMGSAVQGDEDGDSIYRAALGFRANGWTAGDPWHPCLGHVAGIPRCRRSGAAAMGARHPAPTMPSWGRRRGKGKR
jgi:hypothetical protein